MTAMFPSSWRSPAAVVRLFSRSICPALSSTRSAAVFSSTRVTRLVPWDWRDVVALPGQRHLRRCGARLGGDLLDLIDDAQIALEVLADEARIGFAPVAVGELLGRADLPGEETVAERRVGNEADAQLAKQRQQLGFRIAGPEGVFSLQRGDRVNGVSAADCGGAGLGKADVADLTLGDQLGQGPTVSSMEVFGSTRYW
jgi:hypothetical protein